MRIGVNAVPLRVCGGGARYVFTELMDRLLELDQQNEYMIFSHFFGLPVVHQLRRVHEHLSPDTPRGRVRVIEVASEDDVFHHRHDFDLFFGPLNNLQPRIYDRPSVAILHDIQEQYFPHYFSASDLKARNEIYPEICKSATTLVTISEFCKRSIIEKFDVDPRKIEVIYNAPQTGLIAGGPDDRGAWRREPLPEPFVFYPANWYPHKNHRLLLDALERRREAGHELPNVVFTGFELPRGFPLAEEIQRRRLSEYCHLFREVHVDELRYLYRHAAALVMPSEFEGFGMPAVEAMACGCPVVCSEIPALREVAADAAKFFPPDDPDALNDALDAVLNDADAAQILREAGKSRAGQFTWETAARRMLDVFEEAPSRFLGYAPTKPRHEVVRQQPRVGVMISARSGPLGVTDALRSTFSGGYQDYRVRVVLERGTTYLNLEEFLQLAGVDYIWADADDVGSYKLLRAFAEDEQLDLVGEVIAGHNGLERMTLHSLAWAWTQIEDEVAILGEAWEVRHGNLVRTARLRQLPDGLWRMEGLVYPELLWIAPTQLDAWAGGHAALSAEPDAWRWELVKAAQPAGKLKIVRRTLAACSATSVPLMTHYRAMRAGVEAIYNANGEMQNGRWLLRMKPVLKPVSYALPGRWREKGRQVWRHLTDAN